MQCSNGYTFTLFAKVFWIVANLFNLKKNTICQRFYYSQRNKDKGKRGDRERERERDKNWSITDKQTDKVAGQTQWRQKQTKMEPIQFVDFTFTIQLSRGRKF